MELGSEFNLDLNNLEPVRDSIFEYLRGYNVLFTSSGRMALRLCHSLIPQNGLILLPEYICESVIASFPLNRIRFYKLNSQLQIDIENLTQFFKEHIAVVYLCHYFGNLQGQKQLEQIALLRNEYKFCIIEDTTHSIFSKAKTIGDYCICSIRKWFAIPDGAVLYSSNNLFSLNEQIRGKGKPNKAFAMMLKTLYLEKLCDSKTLYRQLFKNAESAFDQFNEIQSISAFSRFLLHCYSVDMLIKRRKENYQYLKTKIDEIGVKQLIEIEGCPFQLPIIVKNRDRFRTYLTEQGIYCAVHWPMDPLLQKNRQAVSLSKKIISLPIDQRYYYNDMNFMLDIIKRYSEIEKI